MQQTTINSIASILALIRPLEQQGIFVRRSREHLEMEIDKFTIIERDNMTIAGEVLYLFPDEQIVAIACVAVHPDYRSLSRGGMLLTHIT